MKRRFLILNAVFALLLSGMPIYAGAAGNTLIGLTEENDEKESDETKEVEAKEVETEEPETEVNADVVPKSGQEKEYDKANIIGRFHPICQHPELPTGCEITSLTMLLNYYGYPVDKCELSDYYLEKGEVGTVDFYEAFEGDPRSDSAFGCYAPVIVDTANRYLEEQDSDMRARDLTGTEFEEILDYIDREIPVILWGTLDCAEGYYSVTWNVNGRDITWITPEHCRVLVNYDEDTVWTADPFYGEVTSYDRDLFEECYETLLCQAVIIQ